MIIVLKPNRRSSAMTARVAGRGEALLAQVTKDFGISESRLQNWLSKADVEDGHRPQLRRRRPEPAVADQPHRKPPLVRESGTCAW